MPQSMDAPQADAKSESSTFFGSAASEVADFGEGLFHGAIENPINGAVQLTNHLADTHIPELHLVNKTKVSQTIAGKIGTAAGTTLDIIEATVATGGVADALGAAGVVGSALQFGAVGAIYSSVFQPSDPNSHHFIKDRLENGAVSGLTFAAMGGVGGAIDSTGLLAVSSARSLGANLAVGALTGAAGGAVNAEATAVVKDGKALPTGADLAKDVGTYAAFGMAFGAANFAINKLTAPEPSTFTSGDNKLTVSTDSKGNPIKFSGNGPSYSDPDENVTFAGTKMTDGSWKTTAEADSPFDSVIPPTVDKVSIDGKQATLTGGGIVRQFNDGGDYVRTDMEEEAQTAANKVEYAKYNKSEDVGGVTANSRYDSDMRLTQLKTTSPSAPNENLNSAYITYGKDGGISSVTVDQAGQESVSLSKQSDSSWSVWMNNSNYKWNGDVKVIPGADGNTPQVQFTPAAGSEGSPAIFNPTAGSKPVSDMMQSTATYVPGGTGRPVVSVDSSGNASLTAGTENWQRAIVDGHLLTAGETVPIKPGDSVQMRVDVGDEFPDYEVRTVKWGTDANNTPVLGTSPLKPNSTIDFDANAGGTTVVQPNE